MTASSSHTDSQLQKPVSSGKGVSSRPAGSILALFCTVAVIWVIFDQLTKVYFEGSYELGQTSAGDFGLFRFRLVHNTGMAWGLFGDSTFALGVLSCVVCVAILVAFLLWPRLAGHRLNWLETLGLALVFAGGLGNALDRFIQGFVVDFIDFTFIDFPVFNVADIGVTCGFAIIVIGFIVAERKALLVNELGVRDGASDAEEPKLTDAAEAVDKLSASDESGTIAQSRDIRNIKGGEEEPRG